MSSDESTAPAITSAPRRNSATCISSCVRYTATNPSWPYQRASVQIPSTTRTTMTRTPRAIRVGTSAPRRRRRRTTGREPRTGSDSKLTGGELTYRTCGSRDRCEDLPVASDLTGEAAAGEGGGAARQEALERAVRELEQHVAAGGWDGPVRLFALVRTAGALERAPQLASRLPPDVVRAALADPEHLTLVEQEGLPDAPSLEELLGGLAWPDTVDGAAIVTERVVVPPEVEAQVPDDPAEALTWLANHPARREVRLAAAALRDGTNACAVRARDHDRDSDVAVGRDLVPGLVEGLTATLR